MKRIILEIEDNYSDMISFSVMGVDDNGLSCAAAVISLDNDGDLFIIQEGKTFETYIYEEINN